MLIAVLTEICTLQADFVKIEGKTMGSVVKRTKRRDEFLVEGLVASTISHRVLVWLTLLEVLSDW